MRNTLHEAIVKVLRLRGRPMSAAEIASDLNSKLLYERKDGKPIGGSQVSARVRNYPDLLCRVPEGIWLAAGLNHDHVVSASQPKPGGSAGTFGLKWPSDVQSPAFRSLGTMARLVSEGLPSHSWLSKCGVYVVLAPKDFDCRFLDSESVSAARNVIRPWSQTRLEGKWVPGTRIVYIGLAGRRNPRSLRVRIRELIRHAGGHTTSSGPHKGGEILWQLDNWGQLELYATATEDPPVPRAVESQLNDSFVAQFGKLPFGNRQR